MKINFKQLDTNSEKILKFTYGLYPIEVGRTSTWVWTDNLFGGESNDIKSLTIAATSEIENMLLFNGEEMEIQKAYQLNDNDDLRLGDTAFKFKSAE